MVPVPIQELKGFAGIVSGLPPPVSDGIVIDIGYAKKANLVYSGSSIDQAQLKRILQRFVDVELKDIANNDVDPRSLRSRGKSNVDVLASLDFYGPRHCHPDHDCLVDVSDEGSREMVTACFVPKHHDAALKGEQCGEYPCKDVDIAPDEVGRGYDMSYNGIHFECSQSLMLAEEDLAGGLPEERNREEYEKAQRRPALSFVRHDISDMEGLGTYDQSIEIFWHAQREADTASNHDEDVEEHKKERHHACRAKNHLPRQGDAKQI
ncbi:hypothetical protein V491_03648 [Pseudogymnoascus sp. VKM F-3775]|nr:hypothetical protein V491_03648 [Pseudogymnoascus sp. VKM F-3775]